MDRPGVSYEKAYMATPKEEYFGEMLEQIIKHNHRHGTPMSNKKLRESVIRVVEDEEKYAKRNVNDVTTDTLFHSSTTVNTQKKDANVTYERRIASGILAEIIEEFKGCTIQSTINDSGYCDSSEQVDTILISEEKVDARKWLRNDSNEQVDPIDDSDKQVDAIIDSEKLVDAGSNPKSDPSSNPKVATYTSNKKFTQKLLISRFVPKIIPVAIGPINQPVTDDVLGIQEMLGLRQTVLPKVIITDTVHSGT